MISLPQKSATVLALFVLLSCRVVSQAADGYIELFNGRDLSGWDGNPELWTVKDGVIVGETRSASQLSRNEFLIWRGGIPRDFELRAVIKQTGNNSGIQYRSRELPEVGPWVVSGYQLDVHPIVQNNGQLYEERGRLLMGRNGHRVVVDPMGVKWLVLEKPALQVSVEEWNEYVVIARGNHIIHQVNGVTVFELHDHQEIARRLEGILAIQVHSGPPMQVSIKSVRLKILPNSEPGKFEPGRIPPGTGVVPMPAPPR